ncbi:MAG: sugar transferase, partial [Bacteroidales bacterium]|nr:sugar transferase [Bacteroidales bacterium]
NPYRDQYRILPKTEVMGRLSYMGFDIVTTRKIEGITYVVALKIQSIDTRPPLRFYGPLIKLRRTGKNGKPIIVYKFRTMYAYSEFLQEYMYKTYDLQDGGKFTKDIRVSSWGRFMRKYFLDELPMVWNILKGEMKLVGVRPLSNQYLSLYTEEVQQLRRQYKPGLLPPFYADLPGTLEEIQQSEVNYLKKCEQEGVLLTDLKYFFKIIYTILFKHAKSA